jgi:hypothetical protein
LSLLFLQVHLTSWFAVAVCLSCLPFVVGLVLILFPQVKLLGQTAWWMLSFFVPASCSLVCFCSVCVAMAAVIPDCSISVLGVTVICSLVAICSPSYNVVCHPWILLLAYAYVYGNAPVAANPHAG